MKQLAIFSFLHFVSGNDLIYGSLLKTLRGENVSTNALIGLGKVFPYVFPNSTNCIQAAIDDSMFAQKILKLICASGLSPSIVRIGKDASGKPIGKIYCNFFLILSLDVQGMIQLLPELPKAADHRILTFIKSGDVDHLGSFLNNRTALFGDAQVLVSLLKNTSIAFKLDQPTRIFTKEIIDNNVWEVRLKGIMDFKGRQIKVATFNCTFFSRLGPTQENGEPTFADGFEISVFKEILKRINATYKVVPMKENEKFGKFVNGSYVNGLFGKIIHGLVDIGFCGSLIDANKTSLNLEMSDPTLLSCFKYAVHRPDEISKSFTTVLRPFGLDTWLTLISTILAMSVVLLVFANVDHNKIKKYKNLGNCLLTLVGTLVNGSWPKLKKYLGPLRHVIAWWIVFTLLITTSYTSKLVSELATTRYDRKPNYIKEFLKEDFYWPITAQPYAGVFDMNSEKYKAWLKRVKIVESNELNNLLKHDRKAVILTQQIRGKSFVFNHEIDEEVLERYETVDHCLTYSFIGFIYRSGSPFNKAFDHHLINLMETGVTYYKFRRIIARMLRGRSSIYSLKETSRAHKPLKATPLKMEHLNGVFDILFFGLFISLMVFIFENVYVKYIKK